MKIGHKLTLGFVGLTLLIVALGYVSLRTGRTTLEEAIGKSSADLAEQILDKINRNIYRRVEEVQAYARDDLAKEYIALSNAQFEKMPDPNRYIEQVDKDWVNGVDLPIIGELTNNTLARELQSWQNFYQNKYGYPLLGEVFITNRFGANVAQTNKTTDYNQANEDWWQIAKRDGLFVSDVRYDESSGTYSTEIAVRIDDAEGNFLGVIKAVPNIKETINIINEAKLTAEYKTIQLHLVNKDAKIIYSTKGFAFLDDVHNQLVPRFGPPGRPEHKSYIVSEKAGEKGILFAHAHSQKYKDFDGLNWTLITETNTSDIFAPIVNLRNTMLLAGVAILGLALLASLVTYRSIVTPVAALQKATIQIASGNLDTNLTISTSDEIGRLAGSFQRMALQLKKTISDLNDEVAGRKKTEEKLRQNQRFLDNIFDSIQDGIGIMDKDLNIVKVNSWLEEIHRDSMPLVGKKCYEAYHKRDSACPECPCVQTLKTGRPHTLVIPNPCSGCTAEWIELSSFALKDGNGNITGVIENIKDVTEQRKNEQALRESEGRLRTILDNIQTGVFIIDPNTHKIIYANPIAAKLTGASQKQLVGSLCHKYICPAEKGQCPITDLGQKVDNSERVLLTTEGKKLQIIKTVVTITLDGRKHLLESFVDITKQKKAESILAERAEQIIHHHNTLLKLANMPEQELDSLLRTTAEQDTEVFDVEQVSIWLFNEDRTEIVCRDQFNKTANTHESGKTLKVSDFPHYFITLENSRLVATSNALNDPRTCEFAETYLKPKGITSMINVPIRLHGRITGIICHEHIGPAREWTSTEQDFAASIADMISLKLEAAERTKAEQALEKLNKDLGAAVAELSRSNRQLQDFVHIAAHDLKTPVRGIGTLADWIVSDYGSKLDEHGREQVRLLKARVIRIDKLIDGMLQFSKITRTRQNEKQTDLNEIVREVIRELEPPDNIEIAVDSLPKVICEYKHLTQAFQSLLSNAVNFMDKPKGLIKVGCVEQGDFWRFYVCDNGPGIEQRHFERIFKIFQTLPRKNEPDTAGIGLAIAKKIVEIYGGKIWVESQPGAGSTFFFTFPKQSEKSIYANTKAHTAC
jgi:PAS domain S-box-containing protein